MDLVVKGRGLRITDQIRRMVEHKLDKLARHAPPVRLEVELMEEGNPRIDQSYRAEVAYATARHTFRAEGAGQDVDSALDEVVTHLERQISSYRGKQRNRMVGRANRIQSPRTSPDGAAATE